MKHYAVREVELNHMNPGLKRVLKDTLREFRATVRLLGEIARKEWDDLKDRTNQDQLTRMEQLVHTTKKNPAKYPEFDTVFYKYPSYYRRSAIHAACGQVSSYQTRLEQYQQKRYETISNGKHFRERPPVLNLETASCPSLYKGQMYQKEGCTIQLKVFIRNTWDWITVTMPSRDRKCLDQALASGGKLFSRNSCPERRSFTCSSLSCSHSPASRISRSKTAPCLVWTWGSTAGLSVPLSMHPVLSAGGILTRL